MINGVKSYQLSMYKAIYRVNPYIFGVIIDNGFLTMVLIVSFYRGELPLNHHLGESVDFVQPSQANLLFYFRPIFRGYLYPSRQLLGGSPH